MLLELIILYSFLRLSSVSCLVKISQATYNQAEAFDVCGFLLDISPQTGMLWISTRDFDLRKSSYTPYYRYGLDFPLSRPWHLILWCILLSSDIAINPDPTAIGYSNVYVSLPPFCRASSSLSSSSSSSLFKNTVSLHRTWSSREPCYIIDKIHINTCN